VRGVDACALPDGLFGFSKRKCAHRTNNNSGETASSKRVGEIGGNSLRGWRGRGYTRAGAANEENGGCCRCRVKPISRISCNLQMSDETG